MPKLKGIIFFFSFYIQKVQVSAVCLPVPFDNPFIDRLLVLQFFYFSILIIWISTLSTKVISGWSGYRESVKDLYHREIE